MLPEDNCRQSSPPRPAASADVRFPSDPGSPGFAEEANRQSLAVAIGPDADDDQAFIDSISLFDEEERQDGQPG